MTITSEIEFCLNAMEDGYRFVKNNNVGVISCTFRFEGSDFSPIVFFRESVACYVHLIKKISNILPSVRAFLFVASNDWFCPNVVDKHKGVWRDPKLNWVKNNNQFPRFIEFSNGSTSRFASLFEIDIEHFQTAAEYAQYSPSSFIFLSTRQDTLSNFDNEISCCFNGAFPTEKPAIDWQTLLEYCIESNNILLKFNGGFDDRQLNIDSFMAFSYINQIRDAISDD